MRKNNKTILIGVVAAVILIAAIMIGIAGKVADSGVGGKKETGIDDLLTKVNYSTATPVKASIDLSDSSLYDELPEISKYPLSVEGKGQVNVEIFSSPEKAGNGTDSWLIDMANEFNRANVKTADGKSVSISVRSISSGLGADYIISNKYAPDMYTPSSYVWGEYVNAKGGKVSVEKESLVGNTAGVLVAKSSSYNTIEEVISAIQAGQINFGYTNPQTSSSGINLLMTVLKNGDSNDMFSATAISAFQKFQNNIPYVAYTTQQMRDSASNGALDGMITEYQTYVNDNNLSSMYKFIPFGLRHDNPLYTVNADAKSATQVEAIKLVSDFLTSDNAKNAATAKGFNGLSDYKAGIEVSGAEISKSLEVYKEEKDAGQDIIAVFIADCSGSMAGDPINQLKSSLSNGMQYINANNYVGLVSYSTDVTIEVPVGKFDLTQKSYFQGALNKMAAVGGTSTYEAVCVGLKMIDDAKKDHPNAKCMLFVLSDGHANGDFEISDIEYAVKTSNVPIYTIGYTASADAKSLGQLSNINEAACISADSEDIVYKIKQLFNAQL